MSEYSVLLKRNGGIMTSWKIYLLTRLDVLYGFCILGTIITAFIFGLSLLVCAETNELDMWWIKFGKKTVFILVLFIILLMIIPTKKDVAMIYFIPKIAQSETFRF